MKPLRTLFNVGTIGGLTDGQLLERFSTDRGEGAELAFAALVERHGPMVRRVCGSVLRDSHDAQDAFQATFLVLVQQARRLWVRDSLGPWLHQVAYRTACCARRKVRRRERLAKTVPPPDAESTRIRDGDIEAAVQQEIARLPEAERAPLVLCDLQNQTQDEAARHLGVPVGTIKGRLARGRAKLRERLTRRGFGPESLIAAGPAATGPPLATDAVEAMTRLAVEWTVSGGKITNGAATLARAVLGATSMAAVLKAGAGVVVLLAAVGGAGWLGRNRDAADRPIAQVHAAGVPAAQDGARAKAEDRVSAPLPETHIVRPTTLRITVTERGRAELGNLEDVFNYGEATPIERVVPEGATVKKGDVVIKRDGVRLVSQRNAQEKVVQQSDAAYVAAVRARKLAELALREYVEGTFVQQLAMIEDEIRRADASLARAHARVERIRETVANARGRQPQGAAPGELFAELDLADRLDAAQEAMELSKSAVRAAKFKRKTFTDFTSEKRKLALQSVIDDERSKEREKKAILDEARGVLDEWSKQIELCRVLAPRDGTVAYLDKDGRFALGGEIVVVSIPGRQALFRIVDSKGPVWADVVVSEDHARYLSVGQHVELRVDLYPGMPFEGVVDSFDRKTGNLARIRFLDPPTVIPGEGVELGVVVRELNDVLVVPTGEILLSDRDEKPRVAVMGPDGKPILRVVKLGDSDGRVVVVEEGLEPNDALLLNPLPLLSEEDGQLISPGKRIAISTP